MFPQGGVNKFEESEKAGRDGYMGWMGFGGSVFQWHPELAIGGGCLDLLEWHSVKRALIEWLVLIDY